MQEPNRLKEYKFLSSTFFDIFNKDEIKEKDVEYLQQFKDEFIGA